MLKIQNVLLTNSSINIGNKKYKKTQIVLLDTKRRYDDFLTKQQNRITDNHDDLPHFIINKNGEIINLVNDKLCIKTFSDNKIDKKIIKIAIENLGWLQKNAITGVYNNWIGDIYRTEPHIENWRNYNYWDVYTNKQYEALNELCKMLCDKHDIKFDIVSSQTLIENIENTPGIVCMSNYNKFFTDINPSFKFDLIKT
jgi:N-acetyl-anhydromuramyl-L-alanine amidase AmpD